MGNLNIYIHVPFCFSKCPYCGFFSCTNCEDTYEEYFKILKEEVLEKAKEYKNREIQTIYIGGGTPNLVPHQYITDTIQNIRQSFHLSNNVEISIELYPQYITDENISAYKKAGVNRMSLGLQTTNDEDLKILCRRYTYEEIFKKYQILKHNNIKNIGVDLIFGYPNHTLAQWEETLELVSELDIQHISCYSLEIEEGTPYGRLYDQDRLNLPTEIENRKMYHYTYEYLHNKGFDQYEISNWSKPSFECKHNLNFWNYQDYMGLGAGAYSRINNTKSHNPENIQQYIKGGWDLEKEKLSSKEIALEKAILGLRLNTGIAYQKDLFQKKYMQISPDGRIVLNREGKDFYNLVITSFLEEEMV